MTEENKANLLQKAKEARERKEVDAKAHASAISHEISQKDPKLSEENIAKKVKSHIEGEKLDSDILSTVKHLEDLIIKRFKRNNPASTGVSIDKIRKLIE